MWIFGFKFELKLTHELGRLDDRIAKLVSLEFCPSTSPNSMTVLFGLHRSCTSASWIERTASFDRVCPTIAADISYQIFNVLGFLYDKNVLHRDLKPENFLVDVIDNKIVLKITDLGFAREFNIRSLASNNKGTMWFMHPEKIRFIAKQALDENYHLNSKDGQVLELTCDIWGAALISLVFFGSPAAGANDVPRLIFGRPCTDDDTFERYALTKPIQLRSSLGRVKIGGRWLRTLNESEKRCWKEIEELMHEVMITPDKVLHHDNPFRTIASKLANIKDDGNADWHAILTQMPNHGGPYECPEVDPCVSTRITSMENAIQAKQDHLDVQDFLNENRFVSRSNTTDMVLRELGYNTVQEDSNAASWYTDNLNYYLMAGNQVLSLAPKNVVGFPLDVESDEEEFLGLDFGVSQTGLIYEYSSDRIGVFYETGSTKLHLSLERVPVHGVHECAIRSVGNFGENLDIMLFIDRSIYGDYKVFGRVADTAFDELSSRNIGGRSGRGYRWFCGEYQGVEDVRESDSYENRLPFPIENSYFIEKNGDEEFIFVVDDDEFEIESKIPRGKAFLKAKEQLVLGRLDAVQVDDSWIISLSAFYRRMLGMGKTGFLYAH